MSDDEMKIYKCDLCDSVFATYGGLRIHEGQVHKDPSLEKPGRKPKQQRAKKQDPTVTTVISRSTADLLIDFALETLVAKRLEESRKG